MRRLFPILVVALLIGLSGPAPAQDAADLTGTAKPAAPAAPPAAESQPTADGLERQLDQAQTEYDHLTGATPPPAAQPAELIERDYLMGELIGALERHLDMIDRLPEAQGRAKDQGEKTAAWRANPNPPSVSIVALDHQRDLLEDTRARLKAAMQRADFRDQQITEDEKRLKANEVTVRQQEEKISAATDEIAKARETWLRDLARLRVRTAAAAMAEGKTAQTIGRAEIAELRALAELQEHQLGEMAGNVHFTEAELNAVLADIDRQITQLQTRQTKAQAASASAHRALDQAQRAVNAYKASAKPAAPGPNGEAAPADPRRDALERDLAVRRLQADTADLIDETVRRMLEVRGWERAGWQFRWHRFNATDQDQVKLPEARAAIAANERKLAGWQQLLADEITRTSQLSESNDAALAAAQASNAGDAEASAAQRSAYRQQADMLREADKLVDALLHTFRAWDDELTPRASRKAATQALREGWQMAVEAARTVWDFELFTAEDNIEVDGKRISAVRSVTVGKSLGVILLVVLGAVISRRAMLFAAGLAATQFGVSKDHASTLTRWLHIVVVTMLFVVALYIANIPLTVFAFLGGALAIGVGFGTQVILKNMISGIILLVERPLRVGDIVEVGAVTGTVTHINVRSSTVRTADGIEILVPNSTFIESNVTNWTYSNARVRRSVAVGTDYSAPPEKVSEVLMGVARKHPSVLKDPEPCVLLQDFGPDSINFILRYWIDYTGGADSSKIASEIRFMIAADLTAAGIPIPFPQRVVHLRQEGDDTPPPDRILHHGA